MDSKSKKIVVMGLGYIGLPTASMLAVKGHQVVGVDVSEQVVQTINSGKIHIVEPDLDILVRSAVNSGNLRASRQPEEADVFIIAVPTPFKFTDNNPKTPDIGYVEAAVTSILPLLKQGDLVILESTSPVGTTERIRAMVREHRAELYPAGSHAEPVFIAHCPERVLPGHILRELVDNDRIVGGITRACAEKARELYKSFCHGSIYLTDSKTAEMAKLTENSFRDVNIAFANELSIVCDELGINVWELIELANKHPRVNILTPGPGVGGHCIAVDPWFIVSAAPQSARLIRTAREINDFKPSWVLDKIVQKANRFKAPVIGCLGLAFKANIDDLRESPALEIAKELVAMKIGEVVICEPNVAPGLAPLPLAPLERVVREADILVVLVDHEEFKSVDPDLLKEKIVIDLKGIWR
ncbi:UDP-N-acetyl-D-mannosamine dehydrogenase [Geomonas paludis]|uniref:UDP-N-acetyl-D-mannosamine dehydrogenase n=1 Tax=Geomonas paludis TaxID=2740185 RepID=A0ABY4LM86_9BACT|nr:UDP-N-acetyl-D-mannosamine dehydrogenase [Geomonas paludis]UPU37627.1 UDP-N-acetyl-D-mannosamine dehydrogenase [Geomonas paludis]